MAAPPTATTAASANVVAAIEGPMNCGHIRISGLVVEYIVAVDVTRVRFPADAHGAYA